MTVKTLGKLAYVVLAIVVIAILCIIILLGLTAEAGRILTGTGAQVQATLESYAGAELTQEMIGQVYSIQQAAEQRADDIQGRRMLLTILIGIVGVGGLAGTFVLLLWASKKMAWFESVLDNIPFPLSITDNSMKWTFINRAVETFLNKKRAEVIGQHCSNWGAAICNTGNCGVTCLNKGETHTFFEMSGMDFRVDIAYLTNPKGNKTGHIEVVQDITEMVATQKKEQEIVSNIAEMSHSFVSASSQISSNTHVLAQGSTEQAATIEELSASITEMAEKTQQNSELAKDAVTLSGNIKLDAEKGNRQMDEMTAAVSDINEASQSIGRVIKVIDDIAFQTNILALNAAVEAARAGQHGKGFAVVADEVRNLAAKSAEAAKDTGALITDSTAKAELGARIARETAESLNYIVSGIQESAALISSISTISEEQAVAIREIRAGIDQVAQVVQQNAATAEENAAATDEINMKAKELEKLATSRI